MSKRVLPGNNHSFSSNSMSTRNVKQTPSAKHPYQRSRYSNGRNTNENTNTNNSSNKRGREQKTPTSSTLVVASLCDDDVMHIFEKLESAIKPSPNKKIKREQQEATPATATNLSATFAAATTTADAPLSDLGTTFESNYITDSRSSYDTVVDTSGDSVLLHPATSGGLRNDDDQDDSKMSPATKNRREEDAEDRLHDINEDHLAADQDDEEEFDEEEHLTMSLNQLTQEAVDFDAMFEDDTSDDNEDDAVVEKDPVESTEQGINQPPPLHNNVIVDMNTNPRHQQQKQQQERTRRQSTVDSFYSRATSVTTKTEKAPILSHIMDHDGRQYHENDVWQHTSTTNPKKTSFNKVIVKIERLTRAQLFGKKGKQQVARVKNKLHLHLEDVPWIGPEEAPKIIQNRASKGRTGPKYVEYKLLTVNSSNGTSSIPRFPLSDLDRRITVPVNSDLVFGYDKAGTTNAGFYLEFSNNKINHTSPINIPRHSNGKPTSLDNFAGAGGMSLGNEREGFHSTHMVDSNTAACSTLRANFPDSIIHQCRVEDLMKGCRLNPNSPRYPKRGDFSLIHSSTPCNGFSTANVNSGANDGANNAETYTVIDVVKHFQPPYITFENVKGIVESKNKRFVQMMIAQLLMMDYQVRLCFLTGSDYGDPQNRTRVIIFGAKEGLVLPNLPPPTHGNGPGLQKKRTVGDAIGFLENISPLEYEGLISAQIMNEDGITEPQELEGHVLKASETRDEDVYLVKANPAPTVTKQRTIRHYTNQKRPLTRLERSQLQSFPPTYKFCGTDKEIRDQIGNAVPICLARAIGRSVMKAIQQSIKEKMASFKSVEYVPGKTPR